MNEQKEQVHYSDISTWLRCPMMFYYSARLGKKFPPGFSLITGSAPHDSAAKDLQNKIDYGTLLDLDTCLDIARQYVVGAFSDEVDLMEDEQFRGKDRVRDEAIDKSIGFARCHHTELAPHIDPRSVEEPWVLNIPDFSYQLAGRKDCVEKNGDVRDLKTTGQSPPKCAKTGIYTPKNDHKIQLTMYAADEMASHPEGLLPERCHADYAVSLKTPVMRTASWRPTMNHVEWVGAILKAFEKSDQAGIYPPNPTSFWCTKRFCGYGRVGECPYFSGRE